MVAKESDPADQFSQIRLPDVKIMTSEVVKTPNEKQFSQVFNNPRVKILIAPQPPELDSRQKKLQANAQFGGDNSFQSDYVYLSVFSGEGCSLGMSCAFPKEEDEVAQLSQDNAKFKNGTSKAIREKFRQ